MSNCPPALEFASPNRPRAWIATRCLFAQLLVWAMTEACKLERGLGSLGEDFMSPFFCMFKHHLLWFHLFGCVDGTWTCQSRYHQKLITLDLLLGQLESLGGGNNYFSFHPGSWWKGSNLTNNFVHGLVQPPTRSFWCRFGKLFDESFVLKKRVPSIFNYHFFKKGGPEYFWRNKHLPRTWTFQHSQCLDLSSPSPTGRIFICEVVSSWKTPIA